MSQKAWINAYTKGSKSLQARLAKIHANNPEFQEFVKKHGFGANLSVKQSGVHKQSIATVKPTSDAHPERSNLDREAMIKAAAEKIRGRRMAHANRVAFGGELGGGFQMPMGGFRQYRESLDYKGLKSLSKKPTKAELAYMNTQPDPKADRASFERIRKRFAKRANLAYLGGKKVNANESVAANIRAVIPGLGKLQAKNRALDLDDKLTQGIQKKTMTRKERMRIAKHVERFARVASGEKAFKRVQATDESVKELDKPVTFDKPKPMVTLTKGELGKKVQVSRAQARLMVKTGWKVVKEDIAYKDGTIAMYKGGWIAKRNGKRLGTTMPTDQHAKDLLDATRKSLAQKTMAALKSKARGVMRGLGVRIPKKPRRAWDAAILPEEKTENSK